jgi:hypothetical protein
LTDPDPIAVPTSIALIRGVAEAWLVDCVAFAAGAGMAGVVVALVNPGGRELADASGFQPSPR